MKLRHYIIGMILAIILIIAIAVASKARAIQLIELDATNFVSLNAEVDESTVADVIAAIEESNPDKPFYIYINSPGGSVIAGNRLVEYLRASDRDIRPIVQEAASMAAMITESVKGTRYITQTGFLMFHHIQTGGAGDIDQVEARLKFARILQTQLEEIVAERAEMTLEDFRKFVGFERFAGFDLAKAHNLIDEKVQVRCAKSIRGIEVTKVVQPQGLAALFGAQPEKKKVKLCPL